MLRYCMVFVLCGVVVFPFVCVCVMSMFVCCFGGSVVLLLRYVFIRLWLLFV